MPINLTDFTNANRHEDQFSGISELLPNILSGYKTAKAPETHETEMAYKRALTEKALREANGSTNLQGHARDVQDMRKVLADPNVPDEDKKLIQSLFNSDVQNKQTLIDTRNQNLATHNFRLLPTAYQEQILAGWAGVLGDDTKQAIELHNKGETPATYAKSLGATDSEIANLEKIYAATGSNVTDLNIRRANAAESHYLQDETTRVSKNYASRYAGYSPKEVWQSLSSDPKARKERAEFLGAQLLAPEMALFNIKLSSGSSSQKAIDDIEERMLGKAKRMGWKITPEDYEMMMGWANKRLQKGAQIWEDTLSNKGRGTKPREFGADQEQQHEAQAKQTIKNSQPPSANDLQHTADLYGVSIDEVKKKLGIK